MQSVIGVDTKKVYYTGNPAECRRFINDHGKKQVSKAKNGKVKEVSVFTEALRIA